MGQGVYCVVLGDRDCICGVVVGYVYIWGGVCVCMCRIEDYKVSSSISLPLILR